MINTCIPTSFSVLHNSPEAPPTEGTPPLWRQAMPTAILTFYARPLFKKWIKTFPHPTVLILADHAEPMDSWQTLFTPNAITHLTLQEAQNVVNQGDFEHFNALVIVQENSTIDCVRPLLALLEKGGALLIVTQNQWEQWPQWQEGLTAETLADLFAVGFHPKGAVAWWPFDGPISNKLGHIVEGILAFFPGRYTLGLHFGRNWLIRGLKRDDITLPI